MTKNKKNKDVEPMEIDEKDWTMGDEDIFDGFLSEMNCIDNEGFWLKIDDFSNKPKTDNSGK